MNWALLILLSLLVLAGGVGLLRNGAYRQSPRYWKGYYPLILPKGSSPGAAADELALFGIEGTIYSGNVSVPYMAIPELSMITSDELDAHLIPGDPRRDHFLNGLENLFSTQGQPILYLPAKSPLRDYRRILSSSDRLTGASLPDYRPWDNLPGVLVFVLFVAAVVFFDQRRRWSRIAAAIPWGFFVAYAGPGSVPLAGLVWLLPTSAIWARFENGPQWRLWTIRISSGAAFLVSAAVTLVIPPFGISPLFALAILIAAAAGSEGLRWVYRKAGGRRFRSSDGRDHLLFNPVPLVIVTPPSRVRVPRIAVRDLALAFFLLPLVFGSSGITYRLDLPQPTAQEPLGSFGSVSVYRRLFNQHGPSSLPDISDMLASRIGQESFLFGGEYRIPFPGETVTITEYRRTGDRIETSRRNAFVFDHAWFRSFEAELVDMPLGRLYLAQGGPAPVSRAETVPKSAPVPVWMAGLMAIIAVVGRWLTPAKISLFTKGAFRGRRTKSIDKRKREAA